MMILSLEPKTRLTCLRARKTVVQQMTIDRIYKMPDSFIWESSLMYLDMVNIRPFGIRVSPYSWLFCVFA